MRAPWSGSLCWIVSISIVIHGVSVTPIMRRYER